MKRRKKWENCRKIYEYFAVTVEKIKKNFIKNHLFREFSSMLCVSICVCSAGSLNL